MIEEYDLDEAQERIKKIFLTKSEAVITLDELIGVSNRYGNVSVSDLFELIDRSPSEKDSQMGWRFEELCDVARVVSTEKGYSLSLPAPKSLIYTP